MSETGKYHENEEVMEASRLPLITLAARAVTSVTLIASLVLMRINTDVGDYEYITYKNISSYQYAFFAMVVGFGFTLLQLPFAIYYLKTGKRLIKSHIFLEFDFYGDKAVLFLLDTGVGAALGVTVDSKRYVDYGRTDEATLAFDQIFTIKYISETFLLIACTGSAISSIISSLSLSRRR